jgi:hypothetical protein
MANAPNNPPPTTDPGIGMMWVWGLDEDGNRTWLAQPDPSYVAPVTTVDNKPPPEPGYHWQDMGYANGSHQGWQQVKDGTTAPLGGGSYELSPTGSVAGLQYGPQYANDYVPPVPPKPEDRPGGTWQLNNNVWNFVLTPSLAPQTPGAYGVNVAPPQSQESWKNQTSKLISGPMPIYKPPTVKSSMPNSWLPYSVQSKSVKTKKV